MKIPNINCKHYSSFGQCMHPGKEKVFFFFRPNCILTDGHGLFNTQCMIREEYDRPNAPPAPPIPPAGRDIKEGEQPPKPKRSNEL